ncbi:MAG: sugar-binding domain-containing protein, partial [Limnochordia bacterium]|nr:beta galactosidase jelly roll domain-containing protein [Limnochordia bacterium]HPZ31801.1 beta galactosidase jelly roll domain-containing protein [Limnochordia bacterium]
MSIQFWMIPIICAVLMLYLSAAASAQTYTVPESPSVVYNFNLDWKFHKPAVNYWPLQIAMNGVKDAQGRHFYDPDYDDSAWEDVSLPHTFNDVDSFRSVAHDAGDQGVWRGIAFYRKTFSLPESFAGRKVFIEFEGVRQAAYVYLNGVMVGYYEAGVTPFGFDLTKHVKFGEKNVLAVAVDNTAARGMTNYLAETRPGTAPGSNTGVAFQWNTKDFNPVMGGLTRNVRLYVKPTVYQTLPLYSNL